MHLRHVLLILGAAWAKRRILDILKVSGNVVQCETVMATGESIAYVMTSTVRDFACGAPVFVANYKYEVLMALITRV